MIQHVHAEVIKEWADDTSKIVQCRQNDNCKWADLEVPPVWNPGLQYRIKPEPKIDSTFWAIKKDYQGVIIPGLPKSSKDSAIYFSEDKKTHILQVDVNLDTMTVTKAEITEIQK